MTSGNFHASKRGPGRRHANHTYRNGNGHEQAGQYGKALAGYIARKQAQARMERAPHGLRDENGAYTLVGQNRITGQRRIWLAGISAQRGY